jgi:hypothetical protein
VVNWGCLPRGDKLSSLSCHLRKARVCIGKTLITGLRPDVLPRGSHLEVDPGSDLGSNHPWATPVYSDLGCVTKSSKRSGSGLVGLAGSHQPPVICPVHSQGTFRVREKLDSFIMVKPIMLGGAAMLQPSRTCVTG